MKDKEVAAVVQAARQEATAPEASAPDLYPDETTKISRPDLPPSTLRAPKRR